MSARFEELDRQSTPLGEISVRRRIEPTLQVEVFEVRLDDEFLMSSLFTVAETALGTLGTAAVTGEDLDVVVGGLGLGYTARAVLQDRRVRSLTVVEALAAVIEWHERGLLPLSAELASDDRCHVVQGDFFALVREGSAFGAGAGADVVDAVLVDIDHTPEHLLHPGHAGFYRPEGLRQVASRLRPGGVLGLWSDAPAPGFAASLQEVFATTEAHTVTFPNHYTGGQSANVVYLARTA